MQDDLRRKDVNLVSYPQRVRNSRRLKRTISATFADHTDRTPAIIVSETLRRSSMAGGIGYARGTASYEGQTDQHEQGAKREESEIPEDRVPRRLLDVVQPEDVVINDTFDQVEPAPPDGHPAQQPSAGPRDPAA